MVFVCLMPLLPVFLGVALASHGLILLFSMEMSLRAGGDNSALITLHVIAGCALALSVYGLSRPQAVPEQEADETATEAKDHTHTIDARFEDWRLTPAERDVAWFTMKGLSIGEIAAMRGTSEGTVKAQGNAIYRKAGVAGRVQLLAAFMDELLLSGDSEEERRKPSDAA